MNVIGIIAEYNPFHNGHVYQINEIKKMYPDSIIIAVISTHFTMRGELSVLNKWDKTTLALNNGIDIVLELPFKYSNQSADTFSKGALSILNKFKIDTLVFGSESNDIDKLIKVSKIQLNNNNLDTITKEYLSLGYNYPTSLSKAIYKLTKLNIKESNDLLGISYIKEILSNNYPINIVTIKRTNNFYKTNNTNILSAYILRDKINNNISISNYIPNYNNVVPYKIDYNKLFLLLKYKILSTNDLSNYHLITEGIENRIYNSIIKSNNYNELINNITNKRTTKNKINRILINILVGYTSKDNNIDYNITRVLGLSNKGRNYLNTIKKDVNITTKFIKELNYELKLTRIYSILVGDPSLIDKEIKTHTILK